MMLVASFSNTFLPKWLKFMYQCLFNKRKKSLHTKAARNLDEQSARTSFRINDLSVTYVTCMRKPLSKPETGLALERSSMPLVEVAEADGFELSDLACANYCKFQIFFSGALKRCISRDWGFTAGSCPFCYYWPTVQHSPLWKPAEPPEWQVP